MIELNSMTVIIGLLFILIGPASGIWSGFKMNMIVQRLDFMAKQNNRDREETREWLKDLQLETSENRDAVNLLKDRQEREN